MIKKVITVLVLLSLCLGGCGGGEDGKEKVYHNTDFGFSVNYPADYRAKEIKWLKESTGVELEKKGAYVTVRAMAAGTMYENMSFDRYVRIAAASEIQNYEKLVSIESFTSEYGIKGYKTYWEMIVHEDTDTGEADYSTIAGPIYYFPPIRKQKLGEQPVNTIMISCYEGGGKDVEQVAASFRYLTSFKTFFRDRHRGKLYFVKKDRPFRIELEVNPTTGYNWFIVDMDESYFKVRSSGYQAAKTGLIGTGGISYWEIVPLKEGVKTIRLLYYRSWEGKDKAVDEYKLVVVIR